MTAITNHTKTNDLVDALSVNSADYEMTNNNHRRILLLTTGGTIASAPTATGYAPTVKGDGLMSLLADTIAELNIELTIKDIMLLDSSNITPRHWQIIARTIAEEYSSYDGIIVTHGTDTMAYTAAALHYMLENIPLPVILTGSQRTLHEENTDAIDNLTLALTASISSLQGVYLAFHTRLIKGNVATKLYSENLDAFHSINAEDIGYYDIDRKILTISPAMAKIAPTADKTGNNSAFARQSQLSPLSTDADSFQLRDTFVNKVAIVKLYPSIMATIITNLIDTGYTAIIIEGYGLGGIAGAAAGDNYNLLPALTYAREQGVQIIITTQCRYDGADIARYEVGQDAQRLGAIAGGKLTIEALYAKALLGLI